MRVTLSQFLERLFEDGRVMVSAPEPVPADELRAAEDTLAALEAAYRLDLPGEPPPLAPAAARWAAVVVVPCLPVRGLSQCGRGNDRRRPRRPRSRRRGRLATL